MLIRDLMKIVGTLCETILRCNIIRQKNKSVGVEVSVSEATKGMLSSGSNAKEMRSLGASAAREN